MLYNTYTEVCVCVGKNGSSCCSAKYNEFYKLTFANISYHELYCGSLLIHVCL